MARIQVETVVGGVPSGVVLGQAQASMSGNLSITMVIPSSNVIPQVAGRQYAHRRGPSRCPPFFSGQASAGSWNGSDGNVYPAGTLLASFDNNAPWQSYARQGFDVHIPDVRHPAAIEPNGAGPVVVKTSTQRWLS